jgi:two-component system, NarL family, response regulator NreC
MKSILIVDDNRLLRRCIHQLFEEEHDFEVCGEAENGREALEMAQQLQPDAILLDLAMPVMNGLDAARVLSRSMPETTLILFSSYTSELPDLEAQSAGFAAQVSKSENIATLIGKARELLCVA